MIKTIYLLEKGAPVHPNVAFEQQEWPDEIIDEFTGAIDIVTVDQQATVVAVINSKPRFRLVMPLANAIQPEIITFPLPQIRNLVRAERTQQRQIVDCFKKIRLALPVMADEHIYMIVQLNAQGVEIPEIRYGNLFEHVIPRISRASA